MIQSHNHRILIIAPSWVGDMVMAQTLFITLKNSHPDCVIDVLAPAWCKPLLERMPEVRNSFDLPFAHGELNIRGRRALGKSLRGKYDQAIVLPNSFKSALLPWFADIPQRTGWRGEMRYGLLNDLRILDKEKYPLMVQRFMALAYPPVGVASAATVVAEATPTSSNIMIPQPKLLAAPTSSSKTNCRQKFFIDENKTWIGLCPGAEFGPAKRWPSTHYAALATQLIDAGFSIALFGSTKDQTVTAEIRQLIAQNQQQNIIDLAGKTQLSEAVDLLAAMSAVVSNDSGLMHIAAAVQRPIIAIYGSTSPRFTPPLATAVNIIQGDIACAPCFLRECPKTGDDHLRCLNEILPEQVFTAVQNLLPRPVEIRA